MGERRQGCQIERLRSQRETKRLARIYLWNSWQLGGNWEAIKKQFESRSARGTERKKKRNCDIRQPCGERIMAEREGNRCKTNCFWQQIASCNKLLLATNCSEPFRAFWQHCAFEIGSFIVTGRYKPLSKMAYILSLLMRNISHYS